ncbi:MAG: DoxX family protein [Gemmataceae bacterium]|nr:DoxX family protein [Gemmataceae bacterium]
MESKWRQLTTSIGLLILRLGVGGFMANHGWGKLQMVLDGNYEFPDPLGLGQGLSLVMAMLAEFVCSLAVMVGFLTRLTALPVVFTMGVAAFVIHAADPLTMPPTGPPSKESALLFLIPFLALVFTGAGKISVDALIWKSKTT